MQAPIIQLHWVVCYPSSKLQAKHLSESIWCDQVTSIFHIRYLNVIKNNPLSNEPDWLELLPFQASRRSFVTASSPYKTSIHGTTYSKTMYATQFFPHPTQNQSHILNNHHLCRAVATIYLATIIYRPILPFLN